MASAERAYNWGSGPPAESMAELLVRGSSGAKPP